MITKESLQEFVDSHLDQIGEVCSGGLKDSNGKWILICPVMERFNLDFSKVGKAKEESKEAIAKPKKKKKSK